ncbi:MarC family protein [Methanosphaerula subterraneus]|uniref:MarC family protein n=1 Tax=Methanosphaerula subterraneus TaxID=3350244 RepID=UPI003F87D1ED
MTGDILTFALLSLSSIFIIVNPLSSTLLYVSLTGTLDHEVQMRIATEAAKYALAILVIFALLGGVILQLFGITLEAFRIAGGILLFVIGMEMVYARNSRSKMTATEKYEGIDAEDVSVMPLAIPMIAGPGAITTSIVLMNEAKGFGPLAYLIVIVSIVLTIGVTYYMMRNADYIVKRIGQREFRAVNRLMGMLLIAIAVQFVIIGLKTAFPTLAGV